MCFSTYEIVSIWFSDFFHFKNLINLIFSWIMTYKVFESQRQYDTDWAKNDSTFWINQCMKSMSWSQLKKIATCCPCYAICILHQWWSMLWSMKVGVWCINEYTKCQSVDTYTASSLSYPNLGYLRIQKYSWQLTIDGWQNTPWKQSSQVPTPHRGETAPHKKDTQMPMINKRTEEGLFSRDTAQPTRARCRPRSRLCTPNWIRQSDAQAISKDNAGIIGHIGVKVRSLSRSKFWKFDP